MSAFATSVTKLAGETESKRARSLIASLDEVRIVTRDVERRTVFTSLSAPKCLLHAMSLERHNFEPF